MQQYNIRLNQFVPSIRIILLLAIMLVGSECFAAGEKGGVFNGVINALGRTFSLAGIFVVLFGLAVGWGMHHRNHLAAKKRAQRTFAELTRQGDQRPPEELIRFVWEDDWLKKKVNNLFIWCSIMTVASLMLFAIVVIIVYLIFNS